MNWQWAAGTGTDTRFNRTYNVVLQARRHDPHGTYVRRYVEELAGLDDAYVHEPWLLPEDELEGSATPAPIVDQDEASDRLRRVRPQTYLRVGGGWWTARRGSRPAMLRAIPPKTMPWNGATAHQ